jgi:hypothetical protein
LFQNGMAVSLGAAILSGSPNDQSYPAARNAPSGSAVRLDWWRSETAAMPNGSSEANRRRRVYGFATL